MTDISYFSETKMNEKTAIRFCEGLPSGLKHLFFFRHANQYGRISQTHNSNAVLQGYRGPAYLCDGSSGDSRHLDAYNGIQEIRYWYGEPKTVLLVPVLGWLNFGAIRFFEDTNWHSIFFDSSTGEALSTDRTEVEEMMQTKKAKQ
jgi:hypothetical protein